MLEMHGGSASTMYGSSIAEGSHFWRLVGDCPPIRLRSSHVSFAQCCSLDSLDSREQVKSRSQGFAAAGTNQSCRTLGGMRFRVDCFCLPL
jgi:hypothetical protein